MHRRRKPLRGKRKKPTPKNKLTYGIVAVAVGLICFFAFFSFYSNKPSSDNQTAQPKAALIDHLSFSSPPRSESEKAQWESFKDQCRTILKDAGFDYTYHRGEEVTVDFYRNLPRYDYSLIILRVHSAVIKVKQDNLTVPTDLIGLFTSEIWSDTRASEFPEGTLARSSFPDKDDVYFGITPLFVQSIMDRNFGNTVIIMTGCEGLNRTSMADALVHWRQVKVYISWTGFVSIHHTDRSTIELLKNLLQENQTIKDAVKDISPDPTWQWSRLDYYPKGDRDVGNYRIHHFISKLSLNVAEMPRILILADQAKPFFMSLVTGLTMHSCLP